MDRHVLSVLVINNSGVLSRVTGLFGRRGYNIDSLAVGKTEDPGISRITIVVYTSDDMIIQIINQVSKLEEVIKVVELYPSNSVFRELVMIKIDANNKSRAEIVEIANIFRARIVDVAGEAMIVEVTGDQSKIDALITMLNPYGVKEVIRTGLVALERGEQELKKIK